MMPQTDTSPRPEERGPGTTFRVFAYGSLLFEPECPAHLRETFRAVLPGFRRAFNKISLRRATNCTESFNAFALPGDPFQREGKNLSLALGTESAVGETIVGGLQVYPTGHQPEVQQALDQREGFSADRPSSQNGYLRSEVIVRREQQSLRAITYLTNPDEACVWTIGPQVDVFLRAKVLINATPIEVSSGLARGLDYLQKTRKELASIGERDPALEELVRAVHRFDGPWLPRVGAL